ncbi:invasion associated locus B family protein [Agrobacterium radiobacter]|uniref:invasion associated locus B family protein n=1 Tax=Agrobacterium radiobacter TaxID=362 RepID=UPI0013AF6845
MNIIFFRENVKGRTLVRIVILNLIIFVVLATLARAQDAKSDRRSVLPSGASSLTETFEDWTVFCASTYDKPQCVVWQTQTQEQSGQHVLDLRFGPVQQGEVYNGDLTLPFGLEFTRGVTVQLDDGQNSKSFAFKTCLPAGCIVPINFHRNTFDEMRKATTLRLVAVSIDLQVIPFTVSLKGFGAAFDRASALAKGE